MTVSAGSNQPGSCTSADSSSYSMLILMANAYADLGKYHGITPYVGAGYRWCICKLGHAQQHSDLHSDRL